MRQMQAEARRAGLDNPALFRREWSWESCQRAHAAFWTVLVRKEGTSRDRRSDRQETGGCPVGRCRNRGIGRQLGQADAPLAMVRRSALRLSDSLAQM